MSNGAAHWQQRLGELATAHQVPGASLAILDGDQVTTAACGVLNRDTAVAATPGSVFQIGSVTKVWTTTLIMQLAEQGRLDLDAPVAEVLPELVLATPGATGQVTVAQLLCHTSGIDGDLFDDTGRGDDCVARYVAACERLTLIHPPGATMSYCNAAFVIAGRIVERLTGGTWDAALRRGLIEPLGLRSTVTLPEEAIRYRAAFGHVGDDDEQKLARNWVMPRGAGPAGLITATAGDVIEFARLHLRGGLAADGTRLLSAAGAAAMREPRVEVPGRHPAIGQRVGLGWLLSQWDGQEVFGHDGGTIGQYAFLRVLPSRGGAVCLLTNGGQARRLYQELFAELSGELWGVIMPAPAAPSAGPHAGTLAGLDGYQGRYERESIRIDVEAAAEGPVMTVTDTGPLADQIPDPVQRLALTPADAGEFVTRLSDAEPWQPVVFYQLPSEERYVHFGGRATPRRS